MRAQREIETLPCGRHRLAVGMDDDFQVRNLSEIAAAQEQSTGILTTLLAAIAVVSLVVGGIGIMNIMLVSVTERTCEIRVRMEVGARSWHILGQLLAEALALASCAIGIVLGLTIAGQLASHFHIPSVIHWDVIALGGGRQRFGLYPARKASRLDPIDAPCFEASSAGAGGDSAAAIGELEALADLVDIGELGGGGGDSAAAIGELEALADLVDIAGRARRRRRRRGSVA